MSVSCVLRENLAIHNFKKRCICVCSAETGVSEMREFIMIAHLRKSAGEFGDLKVGQPREVAILHQALRNFLLVCPRHRASGPSNADFHQLQT